MMKITEFSKQLMKRGVAKLYRYKLELTPPSKISNGPWYSTLGVNSEVSKYLEFQCTSVISPSTNINLEGDLREIPISPTFEEMRLSIRCGEDLMEKKFFDAWYSSIVNPDNFTVSYLDEISTKLKLYRYDNKGNVLYTQEFIDAYPRSVSGAEFNQDPDRIEIFEVSMKFRKWKYV